MKAHPQSFGIHIVLADRDFDCVRNQDVLPLRPDLYLEACRRFGDSRVKDAADVMTPHDVLRSRIDGERWASWLVRCVEEDEKQPWLEGAGLFLLHNFLLALSYSQRLLTSLASIYDVITIPGKSANCGALWSTSIHGFLWHGLNTAGAELRKRGVQVRMVVLCKNGTMRDVSKRPHRKVMFAAKHGLGWICNHVFVGVRGLLKTRGDLSLGMLASADVLLAGIQPTDVVRQGELAGQLEKRFGDRFLWLQGTPDDNLEEGERRTLNLAEKVSRRISADAFARQIWRWWPLKTWSMVDVAWQLAKILRKKAEPPVDVDQNLLVELLLNACHTEAILVWKKWCRILDQLRPRVIIGNSNLFDMAFIAAWARRRGCPFVMLPHGFLTEPVDLSTMTSVDYVVQFGPLWKTVLGRNKLYRSPRHFINAGPLFLAESLQGSRDEIAHPRNLILYLQTHRIDFPIYSSPKQNIDWLHALCRATISAGTQLILRRHPRTATGEFYEEIVRFLKTIGGMGEVDKETDLIVSALRAKCVVVRDLDTATVSCLIAGIPVVAYLPRCTWPPSDRFLSRVALVARTEDQLAVCLSRIVQDEPYRRRLIEEQIRALQPFVDLSKSDRWGSVVELIASIVEDPASSQSSEETRLHGSATH